MRSATAVSEATLIDAAPSTLKFLRAGLLAMSASMAAAKIVRGHLGFSRERARQHALDGLTLILQFRPHEVERLDVRQKLETPGNAHHDARVREFHFVHDDRPAGRARRPRHEGLRRHNHGDGPSDGAGGGANILRERQHGIQTSRPRSPWQLNPRVMSNASVMRGGIGLMSNAGIPARAGANRKGAVGPRCFAKKNYLTNPA